MRTEDIADLLVTALNALWGRARPCLGDATLAVLFNRALGAHRDHPVVAGLGLHVRRASSVAMDDGWEPTSELGSQVVSEIVISVLDILARATGGALTGALHATLASVEPNPEPRAA